MYCFWMERAAVSPKTAVASSAAPNKVGRPQKRQRTIKDVRSMLKMHYVHLEYIIPHMQPKVEDPVTKTA